MVRKTFEKVLGIGLMVCVMTVNTFATENVLNQKLGIEEVYYPQINDKIGANSYYTRLDYGMSEGTGDGIRLLVLDHQGDNGSSINDIKELYKFIIPNAKVTYIHTDTQMYKDLSKVITEEMIEENDIVCVGKFDSKDNYLYELADTYPDKYFVINGERSNDKDALFASYIKELSILENTLIVAGGNDAGIDQQVVTEDILKLIDIFVQVTPTSKGHAREYSYHNRANESERMDNAVGIAAASLAILLENKTFLGDVGTYYKNNSKLRSLTLQYGKYSFEATTDHTISVLDYKILFKKKDNDNFSVKSYNIPAKFKGDGIKIALIDFGDSHSLATQNYIKHVLTFPQDYKASRHTKTTERMKVDVLRDIVPNAEVTLLSAKSDTVNGKLNTTHIKEALDWILENRDQVHILAINAPIEAQMDKELLKKIKNVADQGIIVSVDFMPEFYSTTPNIITPSSYQHKASYKGYLNTADDLRVYDRFFNNFDISKEYDWNNAAIVSTGAAFAAILKQVDPTITGERIKALYKEMSIERENVGDSRFLDMRRITTLLENQLTYSHDFPITTRDITMEFDTLVNVKIDGKLYRGVTTVTIPYRSVLSMVIDKDGQKIAEGTQLIDLDVVKGKDDTLFMDATFSGKIVTDIGELKIKRGLNKLSKKPPHAARSITIYYTLKAAK